MLEGLHGEYTLTYSFTYGWPSRASQFELKNEICVVTVRKVPPYKNGIDKFYQSILTDLKSK